MRILFCNYEYPPLGGGGGVVMEALAQELARRHTVTVLTSRSGTLPAESLEDGVRVVRVPVFFRRQLAVANLPSMLAYLPTGLWRGLRLGRRQTFDVINTHFVVPTGPVGDWLSRALHVPNVLSVHGGDLFDPSKSMSPHRHRLLRIAIARLLRRADVLVGQSRDTVSHVSRIYGVHRPVELVPLGIVRPPSGIRGDRARFGIPNDAFVMVSVGRLVPRKAAPQLVRVLAALGSTETYLLVVGDGPEGEAVRRLAVELGVADRIRLLGHVSEQEKNEALSVADIFVSTSQHEGFGLVFLEAMAVGLPVVCYDRGGQTDFLSGLATGALVKLNDIDSFTRSVKELYESRDRRSLVRAHNLVRVEDFFIEQCAIRYEALFEKARLEFGKR